MLIDITPNLKLPEYKLVLFKLDETPMQELKNIYNVVYTPFFVGIDELTFSVGKTRTDFNGRIVDNEIYDLIEGDFLIQLNDGQFFLITSVKELDDNEGFVYKEVSAFSREYELASKRLVDYSMPSRKLYDTTQTISEGLELGVLNYIFNHITRGWTIGSVDADVMLKYRHVEFSNSNLLEVFETLQTVYNCIFSFDTIERKINIRDFDSGIGQNQGLVISDDNFINTLSRTIDSDEIKTRLYLYGEDNISIQTINPTGKPYIDNLSFYRNTKYMSDTLLQHLDDYDDGIDLYQPQLNIELSNRQDELNIIENCQNSVDPIMDGATEIAYTGLVELHADLTLKQDAIDAKIVEREIKKETIKMTPNGPALIQLNEELLVIKEDLETLFDEKDYIIAEITTLENYIEQIELNITNIEDNIKAIQANLDVENFFTLATLKELDRFIKVDTYHDASYTANNTEELLIEGTKLLNRISAPKIQFDLDVIDFLQLVEAEHIWQRFKLGDLVNLVHRKLNFDYEIRLISYTHDVDSHSLSLTFSNRNSVDDAALYLRDLIEQANSASNNIDFNKFKWAKADGFESYLTQYIDSRLEDARQDILNATGQQYDFDDSGFWLYKQNLDGSIDPEQLRAINNTIGFTDDNWATVKTAIGPDGIFAELIYGKLGAFAEVYANQIIVGEGGETLTDDVLGGSVLKQNEFYNGIVINTANGFVATRNDDKVRTTVNATTGFQIETDKGTGYETVFDIDIDGNINMTGNITLTNGYINWDNVNKFDVPPGYTDAEAIAAIEATYIDANGVWTPQVYATNINATNGKITTAQIENLVVGSNVTMGPLATISWGQVTNQPDIESLAMTAWLTSNYSTYISSTGIYTGTIAANKILIGGANGSISFNDLSNKPYIPTDSYITNITKDTITTTYLRTIFTETDISVVNNTLYLGNTSDYGTLYFKNGVSISATNAGFLPGYGMELDAGYINVNAPEISMGSSGVVFYPGAVDFNNATVTGLDLDLQATYA